MKTTHKILYAIGALYLGSSVGMHAYGASPEATAIIDNANTLDQTITSQQQVISTQQAELTAAQTPAHFYYGSDKYPSYTVNGVTINAIDCATLPNPQPYQYCYDILPVLPVAP